MIFEGKVGIAAPSAKVWDFLLDVDRFASCVPGVQEVKKIDERTFDGTLAAAVGPISGSFTFRASIVESRPPKEMLARLEGMDSVTKSKLNGEIRIDLAPVEMNRTELAYHATVAVQGRLAILGDMILRTTATLLLDEFIRRLRAEIEDS